MTEPSNRLESIRFLLSMGEKTHSDFNVSDLNVSWLLAKIDRLTGERDRVADVLSHGLTQWLHRPPKWAIERTLADMADVTIRVHEDVATALAEYDKKYREPPKP